MNKPLGIWTEYDKTFGSSCSLRQRKDLPKVDECKFLCLIAWFEDHQAGCNAIDFSKRAKKCHILDCKTSLTPRFEKVDWRGYAWGVTGKEQREDTRAAPTSIHKRSKNNDHTSNGENLDKIKNKNVPIEIRTNDNNPKGEKTKKA